MHGGLLEHLVGVLLGANTHVLLAESLHVLANVCALLRWLLVERMVESLDMTPLTSCSERGTFLSFILWTPAEAEPNSAPAAMRELPFILLFLCWGCVNEGKVWVDGERIVEDGWRGSR